MKNQKRRARSAPHLAKLTLTACKQIQTLWTRQYQVLYAQEYGKNCHVLGGGQCYKIANLPGLFFGGIRLNVMIKYLFLIYVTQQPPNYPQIKGYFDNPRAKFARPPYSYPGTDSFISNLKKNIKRCLVFGFLPYFFYLVFQKDYY